MNGMGSRCGVWARTVGILAVSLSLFLPVYSASAATLTHRWTFDTNADDVVGGANGTLIGTTVVTNGAAIFDGSTNGGVQLPNDLFTNYDSISFEVWFVDQASMFSGAGVYFFGGTNGAISYDTTGTAFYVSNSLAQSVFIPLPTPALTNHLVWTQDTNSQTACIYLNGVIAGQNTNFPYTPALIGSTTTNWIGAGMVGVVPPSGPAVFRGSILEFRAYQGALSAPEVALLDSAGPEQPQATPGDLQGIHLVVPAPIGPGASIKPGVLADYANLTNVNILGQPDLVLLSDDTNVIVVICDTQQCYMSTALTHSAFDGFSMSTAPLLRPRRKLVTMALGSANVTVSYHGFSNTVAVSVAAPQDVALLHRYAFNESTNEGIAHDSVGAAHGRFFGFNPAPSSTSHFTGSGAIYFYSYYYGGSSGGYVDLPEGIISCLSEFSIECWVQGGSYDQWQRICDFGDEDHGVFGKSYFFLTPRTGSFFGPINVLRATIATNGNWSEMPRLNWAKPLPNNATSHVAVTYSPVRGSMKLYVNGRAVDSGAAIFPLASINDVNNWLARSQFGADPYFGGYLYEFRIFNGVLSDADVAADYAAGPDAVGVDFVLHAYPADAGLTITWGPSAASYVLESSPALGDAAVWTPVGVTPSPQNGRLAVTLPMSDNARFFRLHAQ